MGIQRVPNGVRLLIAVAIAGVVLGAAGAARHWWWLLPGALAAATAAIGWRAARLREDRAAWWLMAAAMGTWAAAEVVDRVWIQALDPVPYPSVADGLWLADYPLSVGALALMVRARRGRVPFAFALDGAMASTAVLALAALVVARLPTGGAHHVEVLVNAAYPAGDLLLLMVLAGAIAAGSLPWGLIAVSFGAQVLSDGAYLHGVAVGSYVDGGLPDLGWFVAPAALAVAAWRPAAPARPDGRWRSLVCGVACGAAAVALVLTDHFSRLPTVSVLLAAATILLVIGRLGLVFRDHQRLLDRAREDADTDALTGLGNRRRLLVDLERAAGGQGVLALYDLNGFKPYNDTFGHPAGDELLRRLGTRLAAAAAADGARAYRLGGDEFCLLAPCEAVDAEAIAERGRHALFDEGEGFTVGASGGWARLPVSGGAAAALAEADRRMYAAKHDARPTPAKQAARALMAAVAERHPELGDHVGEVAGLAQAVAKDLGLDDAAVEAVREAAELHDVGKIAIPDTIILKPGPLDDEEWRFMRRHTLIGWRILQAAPDLARVAELVRASHERWDGRGYPDGLAGEAIPLGARIVSVCDAYDAMVADRPYRPARTHEQALAELRRCAGTQFDPVVVEAFAGVLAGVPA